jgi:hypothetical protein
MSSTIQPRFGEDAFPVGRLIFDRARTLGLSRSDLVRRLGYRDVGKGHRVLSEILATGTVPPLAARKFANALEIDQEIVDAVILATTQKQHDTSRAKVLAQEEVYRADFQPHLQVQTERRVPSPIFVAAIMGVARLRIVRLPDEVLFVSQDGRDQIVKAAILEHYRRQGGQIAGFAAITGYVLVLIPGYNGTDFGVLYDLDGSATRPSVVQRLPAATLGLRNGDTRLTDFNWDIVLDETGCLRD